MRRKEIKQTNKSEQRQTVELGSDYQLVLIGRGEQLVRQGRIDFGAQCCC